MKKIILVILLCLLCGCEASDLRKLGYESSDIKIISKLDEQGKTFFLEEYREEYLPLIREEGFDPSCFGHYQVLYGDFEPEDVIFLVSNSYAFVYNKEQLKALFSSEGFKRERLDEYLQYVDQIDGNLIVFLVEEGYLNSDQKDKVLSLCMDPYLMKDKFGTYLEYYDSFQTIREVVEYVNTGRYLKDYTDDAQSDMDKGYQVIVNKYNYLPEGYEPEDLVACGKYGYGWLREEALNAYAQMEAAAREDGMDLYITSSYRSYDRQYNLYHQYLAEEGGDVDKVDTYSARPGHSEHQTGLAVDIITHSCSMGTFEYTKEADWLAENAYKYGFILRYPNEKISITGYKYEPWHYRYVGDIAEDVYLSQLTYDEYYEFYLK